MALFKDTDEIKAYLPVNGTMPVEDVLPAVEQAERQFIVPLLGAAQYNDLNAAYQAETLNSVQTELLKKVQLPLAHYTFYLFVDFGQVQVSGSGVHVITNSNQKSAFQWQIEALKKAYLDSADQGADALLEFLEANENDYVLWRNSEAYTVTKDLFINTATEFSQYVNIKNKRRTFLALEATMRRVEDFYIESTISSDLFNDLKNRIQQKSVDADAMRVIKRIQPALAYLTMARAITDMAVDVSAFGVTTTSTSITNSFEVKETVSDTFISAIIRNAQRDGEIYLRRLKHFLDTEAENYPLYFNSSSYTDPNAQTDFNSADSPIFVV